MPNSKTKRYSNWNLPIPASGKIGTLDRITGPGATGMEIALQIGLPLITGILAAWYSWQSENQGIWHIVLAAVLGFDIAGGIITNSTSSAKRWYHRQGQGFWQHMGFISIHVLHLSLVAYLFQPSWIWLGTNCAILMLAAAVILLCPLYLQRTVSLALFSLALLISIYIFPVSGFEWFLPLFYLKLLVAHLPVEEPYRPLKEQMEATTSEERSSQ